MITIEEIIRQFFTDNTIAMFGLLILLIVGLWAWDQGKSKYKNYKRK
jgi:hypothetical protein